MVHRTSSKTPGFGCYLAMIVCLLLGISIFQYFQKNSTFSKDGISYPPPGNLGCKGWDWLHPYLNGLAYAPAATDASQIQLAVFAYNNLAFYDLLEHKFVRCLTSEEDSILRLSPNGQLLAVSVPSGAFEIRQVGTADTLVKLSTDGFRVTEMEFSPNGQFMAFLVEDVLQLWDSAHPTQSPYKLVSDVAYRTFAFSNDGQTLALADYEIIRQWNTWDWSEKKSLPVPVLLKNRSVDGLIYMPDGKNLLLWNDEGFAVISLMDGREIYRWIEYTGLQEYVYYLAVSPDGRYLALMGHEYWNGSNSRSGNRLPGSISFLNLWRTEDWQYLGQITGDGSALVFSPDSRTLAVNWESKIRFMPLDELIPTLKMPEE